METKTFGPVTLIHGDCNEFMSGIPDKAFDLGIPDPPYGININKQGLGKGGGLYRKQKKYKRGAWDSKVPPPEYFKELFRTTSNQIIWGGNYFDLKPTPCYIIWDKNNGDTDFADAELAWTSFNSPVRIFKFTWSGFCQENMKNKEVKIHETQKPVALYEWHLKNYAKPGQTILDTHAGSFSSAVACLKMGFTGTFIEIDEDYYKAGCDRVEAVYEAMTIGYCKTKLNREGLTLF
jgi:site-specific DNA-methyltransferase (adenine-specific)